MSRIRELKDKAIDILIELRMLLAKQEGVVDSITGEAAWKELSDHATIQAIDQPITSGDAQEMIWGLNL